MAASPSNDPAKPEDDVDGAATKTLIDGLAAIRSQLATQGIERHAANRAVLETTTAQAAALQNIQNAVTRVERAVLGDDVGNVGLIARVVAMDAKIAANATTAEDRALLLERRMSKNETQIATARKVGLAIVTVFGVLGGFILWLLQVRDHILPPKQ